MCKKLNNWSYFGYYFTNKLNTWYQGKLNKAHAMTEVPMTLAKGKGQINQ